MAVAPVECAELETVSEVGAVALFSIMGAVANLTNGAEEGEQPGVAGKGGGCVVYRCYAAINGD
jgi:hypothetical protein